MAYLADLIVSTTPTSSIGLPVDFTGSAHDGRPVDALLVRPIGGPFPVTFANGALTISGSIDADNSEVTASIDNQTLQLLAVLTASEQKLCDISGSLVDVILGSSSFTVAQEYSTSASFSFLSASVSTQTFASASAQRKMLTIYNDSRKSFFVYLGPDASTSVFTLRIPPRGYYELPHPVYNGEITGYWQSPLPGGFIGLARITELF